MSEAQKPSMQSELDRHWEKRRAYWPVEVTNKFIMVRGKLEASLDGKMERKVSTSDLVATELQDYAQETLGLKLPCDPYWGQKVQDNKLTTLREAVKELNKRFNISTGSGVDPDREKEFNDAIANIPWYQTYKLYFGSNRSAFPTLSVTSSDVPRSSVFFNHKRNVRGLPVVNPKETEDADGDLPDEDTEDEDFCTPLQSGNKRQKLTPSAAKVLKKGMLWHHYHLLT